MYDTATLVRMHACVFVVAVAMVVVANVEIVSNVVLPLNALLLLIWCCHFSYLWKTSDVLRSNIMRKTEKVGSALKGSFLSAESLIPLVLMGVCVGVGTKSLVKRFDSIGMDG